MLYGARPTMLRSAMVAGAPSKGAARARRGGGGGGGGIASN